jgi:hypothetical protein
VEIKRRQIESGIQRGIVQYIRSVLPRAVLLAIPNGSQRTASGRPANAVPGFLAGAPDLVLALPNGHVVWIEVKSPVGRLSDNQRHVHALLNSIGHDVILARSIDDIREAFAYLKIKTKDKWNGEQENDKDTTGLET